MTDINDAPLTTFGVSRCFNPANPGIASASDVLRLVIESRLAWSDCSKALGSRRPGFSCEERRLSCWMDKEHNGHFKTFLVFQRFNRKVLEILLSKYQKNHQVNQSWWCADSLNITLIVLLIQGILSNVFTLKDAWFLLQSLFGK